MKDQIVHCIHDEKRTDRYVLLQKEIETQGLTVRYWPAIKDPLNRSFVGISQAHKQIVRWAAVEGLPEVCIMEDDCYFFAPGAWDYYLSQKPADFDIYFGGVMWGDYVGENIVRDLCGMTLYTVSQRFYPTFLSVNEMNHIDRSIAGLGKYLVCDPMVVSQISSYSDNKKTNDSYERYLVGKKLFGGVSYDPIKD